MRYIKKFESYKNMYSEVKSDYDISEDKLIPFTSDEISKIMDEITVFSYRDYDHNNAVIEMRIYGENLQSAMGVGDRIPTLIYKYSDDWYFICVSVDDLITKHYKCDQWDGLISCLKMIAKSF